MQSAAGRRGKLSNHKPDVANNEAGQLLSEEQSYRETVRGIRSYMGWHHILESENPFASSRPQPTGKICFYF